MSPTSSILVDESPSRDVEIPQSQTLSAAKSTACANETALNGKINLPIYRFCNARYRARAACNADVATSRRAPNVHPTSGVGVRAYDQTRPSHGQAILIRMKRDEHRADDRCERCQGLASGRGRFFHYCSGAGICRSCCGNCVYNSQYKECSFDEMYEVSKEDGGTCPAMTGCRFG